MSHIRCHPCPFLAIRFAFLDAPNDRPPSRFPDLEPLSSGIWRKRNKRRLAAISLSRGPHVLSRTCNPLPQWLFVISPDVIGRAARDWRRRMRSPLGQMPRLISQHRGVVFLDCPAWSSKESEDLRMAKRVGQGHPSLSPPFGGKSAFCKPLPAHSEATLSQAGGERVDQDGHQIANGAMGHGDQPQHQAQC
jgi:hypothetical protein